MRHCAPFLQYLPSKSLNSLKNKAFIKLAWKVLKQGKLFYELIRSSEKLKISYLEDAYENVKKINC